jgi:hypothetical protein
LGQGDAQILRDRRRDRCAAGARVIQLPNLIFFERVIQGAHPASGIAFGIDRCGVEGCSQRKGNWVWDRGAM